MEQSPTDPPAAPDDTRPHQFIRPGQVDPDLPPPDNCMICGLPEAAHTDDRPLAELETRFGPSGWEIQPRPGGVAIWIAIKKNGTATRVIAAHHAGELYAKLQAAEQKDMDEGRPLA
jgi:hypothetical protein